MEHIFLKDVEVSEYRVVLEQRETVKVLMCKKGMLHKNMGINKEFFSFQYYSVYICNCYEDK